MTSWSGPYCSSIGFSPEFLLRGCAPCPIFLEIDPKAPLFEASKCKSRSITNFISDKVQIAGTEIISSQSLGGFVNALYEPPQIDSFSQTCCGLHGTAVEEAPVVPQKNGFHRTKPSRDPYIIHLNIAL